MKHTHNHQRFMAGTNDLEPYWEDCPACQGEGIPKRVFCQRCSGVMDQRRVPVPGEGKCVVLYLCLLCYSTIPKGRE